MRNRALLAIKAILVAILFASCGKPPPSGPPAAGGDKPTTDKKPEVAFVTNGVASFWTIAQAGCMHGASEYDANVEVLMPVDGVADQKRMLESLLTRNIDGIALSPIDAVNQA